MGSLFKKFIVSLSLDLQNGTKTIKTIVAARLCVHKARNTVINVHITSV